MLDNQASHTAEYAAAFRALEAIRRPAAVRLFDDSYAILFLSAKLQRIVRFSGLPLAGPVVRAYVDRRWPGAMTSGIARTRLIDDLLRAAVGEGIRQVIILGAGFDCRAFRLAELAACRVVEVDHPATQALKRERLARIGQAVPATVTFHEADLKRQDLREVLQTAGLTPGKPSFVLWEGVTHYLGEAGVDATLRTLAAVCEPGSRLVFTYLHGGLLDGSVPFEGAHISKEQVAGDGEPWVWGMVPEKMPAFLAERGFRLLADAGADDYRARYWGEAGRRMRGFSFYRVAHAELAVRRS
ncbi:MAG: SAM-dependent methyltransferase [Myxococcales bacterium]|nr:SAM-dependent methyltransferase [Myxococcales bacterium]